MKYLIFIIVFLLVSCERGADLVGVKNYSNNGIIFQYPGNWEVSEDSESDDVRFIFVESPGAGIMKIEIYDYGDSFDLKEFVQLDIESFLGEMSGVFGVEGPDLITETEKSFEGNKLVGFMYEINMSVLGIEIPHITEVYEVSNDKKSAYLSGQVATEDSHLVTSGFDLILSSFQYENP